MPPGFVDGRYYQPPRSESSNLGDHGAPLVDDVLRSGDGTPDWAHHHGSIRHVQRELRLSKLNSGGRSGCKSRHVSSPVRAQLSVMCCRSRIMLEIATRAYSLQ